MIPKQRPYEAVVFRDYFVAGLDFPSERFVNELLRRFEIQLHQLSPNAFTQLSVFAMAMKMLGHVPNAEGARSGTPLLEKKLPLEFGAFNLICPEEDVRHYYHCANLSEQVAPMDQVLVLSPSLP